MPRPRNPYRENAFALLEVLPSASTRELVSRARRKERRIKAQLDDTDLSLVIEARRRLEDPNQRLAEELFYHGADGVDEAELGHWIDRFGSQPLEGIRAMDEHTLAERWQATLHRLPADSKANWTDPEPVRVTILERGDCYEQADAPVEAITFDR